MKKALEKISYIEIVMR